MFVGQETDHSEEVLIRLPRLLSRSPCPAGVPTPVWKHKMPRSRPSPSHRSTILLTQQNGHSATQVQREHDPAQSCVSRLAQARYHIKICRGSHTPVARSAAVRGAQGRYVVQGGLLWAVRGTGMDHTGSMAEAAEAREWIIGGSSSHAFVDGSHMDDLSTGCFFSPNNER